MRTSVISFSKEQEKEAKDMDEAGRLEIKYDVKPKAAAKQYIRSRSANIVAYSALIVCGISLAVFFFRGAGEETVKDAFSAYLAYGEKNAIAVRAAYSAILPAICAVFAVLSGFSTVYVPVCALFLPLYGAFGGTVACVLYNGGSLALCAAYTFSFLLSCLALSLCFTEAKLYRKSNLAENKRIGELITARSIFSYLSNFILPLFVLIIASLADASLFTLIVRYYRG